MESTPEVKVSKMDAGTKKTWKVHQLAEELYKWSAYLQQSTERFEEELTTLNAKHIFVTTAELKLYKDTLAGLAALKKEAAQLNVRARRIHGPRR